MSLSDPADRIAQIRQTHLHLLSNEDILFLLSEVDRLSTERQEYLDLLTDANAVCACGCPLADHENYGEDGLQCEHDDHECILTSKAVYGMLHTLRAKIGALQIEQDALREELVAEREALAEHCACQHDDRGSLVTECEEHERQRTQLTALSQGITQVIEQWRAAGTRQRVNADQLSSVGEKLRAEKEDARADMHRACADQLAALLPSPAAEPTEHRTNDQ